MGEPVNLIPMALVTTYKLDDSIDIPDVHDWTKPRLNIIKCRKCGLKIHKNDKIHHINCTKSYDDNDNYERLLVDDVTETIKYTVIDNEIESVDRVIVTQSFLMKFNIWLQKTFMGYEEFGI